MNEELKKAVEYFESNGYPASKEEYVLATTRLNVLLNLAQSYISCGELEEKKCIIIGSVSAINSIEPLPCANCKNCGYNQAIRQYKLIILRKQEELREKCNGMPQILARVYCGGKHSHKVLDPDLILSVATALTNYLMGKGEK